MAGEGSIGAGLVNAVSRRLRADQIGHQESVLAGPTRAGYAGTDHQVPLDIHELGDDTTIDAPTWQQPESRIGRIELRDKRTSRGTIRRGQRDDQTGVRRPSKSHL